jgi:hypothetical protein
MKIKFDQLSTALVLLVPLALTLLLAAAHAEGAPQGTPFLYRGQLSIDGSPANGTYDLAFCLFERSEGGAAAARPITNSVTKVSKGEFAVTLDFGPGPFTGTNYWLDITVRPTGSNAFAEVSPRRRLTPSPYAHGPQRRVSSVMQVAQPRPEIKLPLQNSNPGSEQSEPSSSNVMAPVPKS